MRIVNRRRELAVALLTLLSGVYPQGPGTCYYPSGQIAIGYVGCDPTAYMIQCCPTGWTCFSNSLCVITDPASANSTSYPLFSTLRGACTDPEWDNAICGNFCLGANETYGHMTSCGSDTYCCTADSSPHGQCDCAVDPLVTVGAGVAQTIVGATGLSHTATTPGTSSPSTTSPPGGTTTGPQRGPTGTSTGNSSPSASGVIGNTGNGTHKPVLPIALPVALVGAAVLAGLAFAFLGLPWIRRRRRRVEEEQQRILAAGPQFLHINDSASSLPPDVRQQNPYVVPQPPGDPAAAMGYARPPSGGGPSGQGDNPYQNGAPSMGRRSGLLGGMLGGV